MVAQGQGKSGSGSGSSGGGSSSGSRHAPRVVRGTSSRVVYLRCPYEEKDDAKAHGAEWDPDASPWPGVTGSWYAPPGVELEPLSRWHPKAFTWLSAGYHEKDAVKALGAQYAGEHKRWYVRGATDLRPFQRWIR